MEAASISALVAGGINLLGLPVNLYIARKGREAKRAPRRLPDKANSLQD